MFGFSKSPFEYTLSMMGNYFGLDERLNFIIWGMITGALFVFYIRSLFRKASFNNRRANIWLSLSNIFLVLTVLTPSVKDKFPIFTRLHFLYTVAFALSLVLSVTLFLFYLAEVNEEITQKSFLWGKIVIGGSALSLFIFGKNGIFELFFFISFSVYLLLLGVWLNKLDEFKK